MSVEDAWLTGYSRQAKGEGQQGEDDGDPGLRVSEGVPEEVEDELVMNT